MTTQTRKVLSQNGAGTEVPDVNPERRHRVAIIKAAAKSTNDGRSYLLRGLRSCRLAAGLTQRQLAEAMAGSQATVGQLERQQRGAYLKTMTRLCDALGVALEDLLIDHSPELGETHRHVSDDTNGGDSGEGS